MANKLSPTTENNNSREVLTRRLAWLRCERCRQRQLGERIVKRAEERLSKPGVSQAQRARILEPLLPMCERLDALERRTKDMIAQVEVELLAPPILGETELVVVDGRAIIRVSKPESTTGPPGPKKPLHSRQLGAGRNAKSNSAKNILSPLKFNSEFYGADKHAPFHTASRALIVDGFTRRISGLSALDRDQLAARNLLRRAAKMAEFLGGREGAS
jgi:hypothetical protein